MQVISRASRDGWTRGRKSAVVINTAELALAQAQLVQTTRERDREVIERVNIEMQARMLVKHRRDIGRAQVLSTKLLNELDQTPSVDEEGVSTLGFRVQTLQRLANSMKTFILLERQAYGVTTALEDPTEQTLEANNPDAKALDLLMSKFASALQKGKTPLPPTPMADVVDVNVPT